MNRLPLYLMTATSFTISCIAGHVWAEEDLLWKSVAMTPAVVVPPFVSQPSPFPQAAVLISATQPVDTAALEEQKRLRDKAYNYAEQLIKNGQATRPKLSTISVGGMVEGILGPRVLVNNSWVGVGTDVKVRKVRSSDAVEALKVLNELDESASTELTQALNTELATNPLVTLVVHAITSTSLVLKSKGGTKYPISFDINSKN